MEEQLKKIENEIVVLQARNARVETDKAWEISTFRIVIIAGMTYVVAMLFMWSIGVRRPFLNALIPTIGFTLSTLSLSPIKHWWLKHQK